VRDGLKPVQRRILYTMQHELRLARREAPQERGRRRRRDGQVPPPRRRRDLRRDGAHGAGLRDARARSSTGHGNFGSLDGDAPAAMRYTEAQAAPLADGAAERARQAAPSLPPNYDGTRFEPVVLPARFPNLLVNGSQGIAVGMATSIPPHNLGEVIDACLA
jgi:DNA gyrase subunit A